MKIILFDIDSTLLHDGGAAGRAYECAFRELFGIFPPMIDKHGKTDPIINREVALAALGRKLTTEEEHALNTRYCDLCPSYLDTESDYSVLEGAAELCASLACHPSVALGLQTGNLEPSAYAKLRRGGLDIHFRFGGFGSDSADRPTLVRHAIERGVAATGRYCGGRDVLVIGDSVRDIGAGRENGAFTVGVTTGNNSAGELSAAGAHAVVKNLSGTSGIREIIRDFMEFPHGSSDVH